MKYLPLLLVLLLLASCVEKKPGPQKPNVVIIFTDDQGYADVGVFGAEGFETPNLDQMAVFCWGLLAKPCWDKKRQIR